MEQPICQSCAMPLTSEDMYSTEKDGSINKDYCKWCYKDGEFVDKVSMEEYIDLLISALELVPPEITLHRISGDAPRATLIAPAWSYKKRTILNNIHKEMRQRDTWQGRFCKK